MSLFKLYFLCLKVVYVVVVVIGVIVVMAVMLEPVIQIHC